MTASNKLNLTVNGLTVTMTRQFNAPLDLVWRANTEPDLIARWWGQRSSETIIDKCDCRTGGNWRFVQRSPDGTEYGFHGDYLEVVPQDHITWTFEFEGMPGHVITETLNFAEQNGVTTITAVSTFDNQADLDGMLGSGMEGGAAESYDRLEELLTSLQNA